MSSEELIAQLATWSCRNTAAAFALIDSAGVVVECNPAFAAACHRRRKLLIGQSVLEALHQPEKSHLVTALQRVGEKGSAKALVSVPESVGVGVAARQWRIELTRDSESGLIYLHGTDRTRVTSLSQELQTRATRDRLTGLENRDALKDDLVDALDTGQPVAVFMVDVDRFTMINDTYGHETGDAVLGLVGRRIVKTVGLRNTVARIGGDQFAVMARRLGSAKQVAAMAARLHQAIVGELTLDGVSLHLRVSLGYSMKIDGVKNAEALFREADTALSRASELGGNCIQQFHPEFHQSMEERMRTESDLRAALGTAQIDADVQGVFECATRKLVSFEALARWRHPERGTVGPWGFIDVADRFGLLNDVMAGVLFRTLTGLRPWLLEDRSRRLAFNVAPSQLLDPGLLDLITATIETSGLQHTQVVVEITENELINTPPAIAMIERISESGMRLAIDDFGAGASSLGYLWALPVSILKIDRSLVSSMTSDPAATRTVAALVALAHDLGLTVVAEGVETEQELAPLVEIGCDKVQGYLLHKPCPMSELGTLIAPSLL